MVRDNNRRTKMYEFSEEELEFLEEALDGDIFDELIDEDDELIAYFDEEDLEDDELL